MKFLRYSLPIVLSSFSNCSELSEKLKVLEPESFNFSSCVVYNNVSCKDLWVVVRLSYKDGVKVRTNEPQHWATIVLQVIL